MKKINIFPGKVLAITSVRLPKINRPLHGFLAFETVRLGAPMYPVVRYDGLTDSIACDVKEVFIAEARHTLLSWFDTKSGCKGTAWQIAAAGNTELGFEVRFEPAH